MAFWRKKEASFEKTHQVIQASPGISQAELARQLGVQRSTIARRLPGMEEAGYLYSEDGEGKLWPFGRKK